MSPDEIRARFPNASAAVLAANSPRPPLPHPEPEREPGAALEPDGAREEKGDARVVVRFVGHRVRPLDPDNFAGSVKDLLDGCRHAGLIPGDEPWRIRLETEQVRVAHFAEEKTEIVIITPAPPVLTLSREPGILPA